MDALTPELITRLKADKGDAFAELVTLTERPLFAHLRRILGDSDRALDALQDTYLKVYRARQSLDPSRNPRSWLWTVTTRSAFDLLRKEKRMPELLPEEVDDEGNETNEDKVAYNYIEQHIVQADLEQALARLKPAYRTVLLLYYKEGLSYEEIAEAMQVPLNSTKTHLRRAKQALYVYLKDTYGS